MNDDLVCNRGHQVRLKFYGEMSPARRCRFCRRILIANAVELSPIRREMRIHHLPPEPQWLKQRRVAA